MSTHISDLSVEPSLCFGDNLFTIEMSFLVQYCAAQIVSVGGFHLISGEKERQFAVNSIGGQGVGGYVEN